MPAGEPPPVESIEFRVTEDHLVAHFLEAHAPSPASCRRARLMSRAAGAATVVFAILFLVTRSSPQGEENPVGEATGSLLFCSVITLIVAASHYHTTHSPAGRLRNARRYARSILHPGEEGSARLDLRADGFLLDAPGVRSLFLWHTIRDVIATTNAVFITRTNGNSTLIPRSAFAGDGAVRRFLTDTRASLLAAGFGFEHDFYAHAAANDVLCPACEYNLRGARSRICPECSTELDDSILDLAGPADE